ncbi:MAG: hypothetical protein K5668_04445 [Lachnospiraceae bacterium]|nr:hypothetical protein [Lachnospiraceae bacterium]
MTQATIDDLSNKINMLSFNDRLRLLEILAKTLQMDTVSKAEDDSEDFEKAFGIWKNKDVSIDSIRQKAWGRS